MLEKIFHLKEKNTTVLTEMIAGLTIFMAMSYIFLINPILLSKTGMPYQSVFTATILASIIGTLFMGVIANVPYAQSAGMGLNAIFTYTLCQGLGFSWQQALAIVFLSGLINTIITMCHIREKLIKAIPNFLQDAIVVGIGLFISYIGIKNANFLQFGVENVIEGTAMSEHVVPSIAAFSHPSIMLAAIGLIITVILVIKKVKGAYLWGIVITTLIGIPMGVTLLPDFSSYSFVPSIKDTFLQLDLDGLWTAQAGIPIVIMTIFSTCIATIFDSIGTLIGTGRKTGIFDIQQGKELPPNLRKAMYADSIATMAGGLLGTSNITVFAESSSGIEAGGKTGLTAVFVAVFMVFSLLLAPIISMIPMAAVAPILIVVGMNMITAVTKIDWRDMVIAIPAFLTMVLMPLSYSITTGIEVGFFFYIITKWTTGKAREVSPILYVFTFLFILDFIYKAL